MSSTANLDRIGPPVLIPREWLQDLGVDSAVLLAMMREVLHMERARGTGERVDGAGYVRLTVAEIHSRMPWWSTATVRRRLAELVERGYLVATESEDSDPRDRALWYALGGEAHE